MRNRRPSRFSIDQCKRALLLDACGQRPDEPVRIKCQPNRVWPLAPIIALLLNGCVAPAYLTPPPGQLDAASVGIAANPESTPVVTKWWTVFDSEELNLLIDKALAKHPSLVIAASRLQRADAMKDKADGDRWPQIQARYDGVLERFPEHALFPPNVAGSHQHLATAQLAMSWELEFFGRHRSALEAALGVAQAAKADSAMARIVLSTQVARTYIQLGRLVALREISERTRAQRIEILALTRRRTDAGMDTAVELLQAEGTIPDSDQTIESIDEQIHALRYSLAALTVQPASQLEDITPNIGKLHLIPLPDSVPADLLGRRADVDAARRRVEAAMHELDVARADFYPSINLVAFAGYNALGLSNLFDGASRQLGVGPAVRLPIFDAGRLRAAHRVKAADLDAAIAAYNTSILQAVRDAAVQISTLRSVERQQEKQERAQLFAERAYRIAVRRYDAGMVPYLSVLAAENSLLTQHRSFTELRAKMLDTQAELARALGGGYMASLRQTSLP